MTATILSHDAAGNLTFNPTARNVGDPCGASLPSECKNGPFDTICRTEKFGCGRGQEYVYDGENRLVAIHRDRNDAAGPLTGANAEPKLMEFVYDALGRRIETVEYINAATGAVMDGQGSNAPPRRTRHVYFGLEMIQEYECSQGAACDPEDYSLSREYYWGDPERYPEVIAMQTFIATVSQNPEDPPVVEPWAAYHYLHDALGSVIGLVDEAGFLVERYTYDPYGKVFVEARDIMTGEYVSVSEPISGQPYSAFGNPFGFTGHVYLPAVGLNHTLFRFYDPILGRWLQRDPIEYAAGSVNLYEYVLSAPLFWLDMLGLIPDIYIKRKDVKENDIGHTWIEHSSGSMGWWPDMNHMSAGWWKTRVTGIPGILRTPDPREGSRSDHTWKMVCSGEPLKYGPGKGKTACEATDAEILACMAKAAQSWVKNAGGLWALGFDTCRDFAEDVTSDCGLDYGVDEGPTGSDGQPSDKKPGDDKNDGKGENAENAGLEKP